MGIYKRCFVLTQFIPLTLDYFRSERHQQQQH
jgi:hypothetical protein